MTLNPDVLTKVETVGVFGVIKGSVGWVVVKALGLVTERLRVRALEQIIHNVLSLCV